MTAAGAVPSRLRIGATLVVAGLAALTVGVGPARAETTLSAPERVTAEGVVPLRAHVDPSPDPTRLTLAAPGAEKSTVLATNEGSREVVTGGDLGYELRTRCARYPGADPCESPVVAPNGVWVLALEGGHQARREFVMAVPAVTPSGVTATALDATTLALRWPRGAEPDVRWTVLEGGAPVVADLTPAAVCDKGSCEARLTYPAESPRERTLVLQATRACPGCGAPAPAPVRSSPATATLPTASPSASPSTGGSPSPDGSPAGEPSAAPEGQASAPGSTGAGRTGGGAPTVGKADRSGFERSIGTFVPAPQRLTLPDAPDTPAAAPADPGQPDTFDEALDYGESERVVVEKGTPGLRSVTQAFGAIGGAFEADRIWRAGAAALLLVMVAAHLRVWLSAPARD